MNTTIDLISQFQQAIDQGKLAVSNGEFESLELWIIHQIDHHTFDDDTLKAMNSYQQFISSVNNYRKNQPNELENLNTNECTLI